VITARIRDLKINTTMSGKTIYQAIQAEYPEAAVILKDIRNEVQKIRDQINKGYPVIQAMLRDIIDDPKWLYDYCYNE
jgi:hypothetical protein